MSASARCVAIIMDGNARWAVREGEPTLAGHRAGAKALKQTVRNAVKLGIQELSVYAFSTENWSRPRDEVEGLMAMFSELIASETPELNEQGVQMRFIGKREGLSADLIEQMAWAESETVGNSTMKLFIAFNYGGRAELLDAAMKLSISAPASTGEARSEAQNEEVLRDALYAPDMTDPDLVIRTSGERRLSNFLIWQTAYSELYFCDTLWPDFDLSEFEAALADYEQRQRRFGAR